MGDQAGTRPNGQVAVISPATHSLTVYNQLTYARDNSLARVAPTPDPPSGIFAAVGGSPPIGPRAFPHKNPCSLTQTHRWPAAGCGYQPTPPPSHRQFVIPAAGPKPPRTWSNTASATRTAKATMKAWSIRISVTSLIQVGTLIDLSTGM